MAKCRLIYILVFAAIISDYGNTGKGVAVPVLVGLVAGRSQRFLFG
jgi:hypothetical protein